MYVSFAKARARPCRKHFLTRILFDTDRERNRNYAIRGKRGYVSCYRGFKGFHIPSPRFNGGHVWKIEHLYNTFIFIFTFVASFFVYFYRG
jgi:hypothetical protein